MERTIIDLILERLPHPLDISSALQVAVRSDWRLAGRSGFANERLKAARRKHRPLAVRKELDKFEGADLGA